MSKITKKKKLLFWKRVNDGTPLTVFHTWRYRCEGVGRDSGCGYEEFHLMYDTEHSI